MELSLPAQDIKSAIVAFENGADSVYFGLKKYSARASSINFSIEDYRKIRRYALKNNKKIYIAFNTILNDEQIQEAFKLLSIINLVGCDGLLVQDWGVVEMVREFFPNIPLHSSTQMAIQNSDGVKILHKLGFKRVVLPRETTLNEMKKIRNENSEIELKVFVHGALCYCISGLCYASKMMFSRGSANKGSCSQVCRYAFRDKSDNKCTPFSLKDLICDKKTIQQLAKIGIDSIKVEGRLKSENYVKWASKYYRSILADENDEIIEEYKNRLMTSFSRENDIGYFYADNENFSINLSGFQGHRGSLCATIESEKSFRLLQDLRQHDGLMLIDNDSKFDKFACSKTFLKKDSYISLSQIYNGKEKFAFPLKLYKIKDSRDNVGQSFNVNALDTYRLPIEISVTLNENEIIVACKNEFFGELEMKFDIKLEKSHKKQDVVNNFNRVFSRKSIWCELSKLNMINNTNLNLDEIFMPSSVLKQFAIKFYEMCDKGIDSYLGRELELYQIKENYKTLPDVVLSPICFDRNSCDKSIFKDKIVEINNISDFLNLVSNPSDISKIKGVVLGAYFNVANSYCLKFFKNLLGDKLVGVVNFVEGDISPQLSEQTINGEEIFRQRNLPYFIKRDFVDSYQTYNKTCKML